MPPWRSSAPTPPRTGRRPEPVTVRIGVHTGEAELREGDYYGTVVNRCARIRGIGHGGQVLLSEATTMLIRDHLPPRAYLLDQGEHRLKDLTRPERVFQVVADDLPREFPPLVSLDIRPHNLPIHPTALLGRERETDEVRQLILQDGVRLVTLTGPGGTGKTRLSLQIAAELVDEFEDGVFVVELAPISNPALVPVTVAQVLGVRDVGGRPILESLKEYLRRRSMLLVLDNFEQILSAASVVADLMSVSPGLRVLVTSREPLHLRGEREYAVPPLALPDARHLPAPEEVARYAAVALFLERAAAIRPDFAVTDENAAAVTEICARLDGLPLAIELAAARVRLLTPQAMLTRLERRLPLLTQGAQDLPARQRTLRDTIAWSYDLLTPDEQALFRRLAIFVGGCTLESAEAAATADVGDRRWGLIVDEVLDGMDSLLSKNLLRRMPGPGDSPRVTMLETVREYGLERLQAEGELHALRRWHAGYFLDLAEQAVPRLQGSEQTAWLDRLEAEHANLRAALDWSLADDRQSDAALRLSGALAWFWAVRGYFSEGRRWLERALAESPPHPTARLAAQYGLGWMAHIHNDADVARHHLGIAIDLARQLDDRWALAWSLHVLGRVEYYANDVAASRDLGQQSLRVAREIDDPWLIAWALHLLGLSSHIGGQYQAALDYYEEALAIRRRIGYLEGIGICFNIMGVACSRQGEYVKALAYTHDGMIALRTVGAHWTLHNTLALGAVVALALGQTRQGVRIAGGVAAFGESLDVRPIPIIMELLTPALADARRRLGEDEYEAAWREGWALSPDEVVAEVQRIEATPADRAPEPLPAGPSTAAPPASAPARSRCCA